jgi:hypothetical protein
MIQTKNADLLEVPELPEDFPKEMLNKRRVKAFVPTFILPFLNLFLEEIPNESDPYDMKVLMLTQLVNRSPEDAESFLNFIHAIRTSKEPINLESAIRFYGIPATRNLILARRLLDVSGGEPFVWNETTGRPSVPPKQVLKFASKAEDEFSEQARYQESAFLAGLVFDLIWQISDKSSEQKKNIQKLVEKTFETALQAAQLALRLGQHKESLEDERLIPATILIHYAGRMAAVCLKESYLEVMESFEKNQVPSPLRRWKEVEEFGESVSYFSALFCDAIPGFEAAADAALFYHFPRAILSFKNQTAFDLAGVCYFSSLFQKAITGEKPKSWEAWLQRVLDQPEIKGFQYTAKACEKVFSRLKK